jgi:hypothetical protein
MSRKSARITLLMMIIGGSVWFGIDVADFSKAGPTQYIGMLCAVMLIIQGINLLNKLIKSND